MNGLRDAHADPKQPGAGLASWYVPGRADGFGDRLLMFDNTGTPSLELLRFRHALAATPGFEDVLRDRVRLLHRFNHPSFAPVKAVQHLDGGEGLALVSVHVPGQRLSELFEQRPRKGLNPGIVTWLLRELTPAVAELQSHGDGIAHGALTTDRIVLTPDGRLCIVEHVLGSALEQLQLEPSVLWREFGLVGSGHQDGAARLDAQADIVQLAGVAISMLLGRPFTTHDLQHRVPSLLDEIGKRSTPAASRQLPLLRLWLGRALQLDNPVYRSAAEAQVDLKELSLRGDALIAVPSPAAQLQGSTEVTNPAAADHAPSAHPHIRQVRPDDLPHTRMDADEVEDFDDVFPSEDVMHVYESPLPGPSDPGLMRTPVAVSVTREQILRERVTRDLDVRELPRPVPAAALPRAAPAAALAAFPWRRHLAQVASSRVALIMGAVILAEAVVIGVLATRGVAAPAAPALVIESPQPGDTVLVNGAPVGATPFQLTVGEDIRSVQVVSLAAAREREGTASALADTPGAAEASTGTTAVVIPAVNTPQRGGVRLQSPIDLTVLQGDRVLGSTTDGPIFAAAGTHQVELVNASLGVRVRQTITVRAGQIGSQRITLPDVPGSFNAQPWARVFIDGMAIGETPLANVPVPLGEHEVIFRNPQRGERRQKITVKADETLRVTASFDKP